MNKFAIRSMSLVLFSVLIAFIATYICIENFKSQLAAKDEYNDYLKGVVIRLVDENISLTTKKDSIETTNYSLRQKLEYLDSEIDDKKQVIEQKKSEIIALREELKETPLGYVVWESGKLKYKEDKIEELIRIVLAESEGDPVATNKNTNGTTDSGLFQINSVHRQFNQKKLLTVEGNVAAALELYKWQGTDPWYSSADKWNIN